jgi:TonB family protein
MSSRSHVNRVAPFKAAAGVILASGVLLSNPLWAQQATPDWSPVFATAVRNVAVVVNWDRRDAKGNVTHAGHLGSALLLDRDRAVTQCSVIANARSIGIKQGRRESEARLIDKDRRGELCELHIDHPVHFNPTPITVRPLADVQVGERVYSVGAPLGRGVKLVPARVSEIRGTGAQRRIRVSAGLIPGYNGGGLFDRNGRLVGIMILQPKGAKDSSLAYPAEYFIQPADAAAGQTAAVDSDGGSVRAPTLRAQTEQAPRPRTAAAETSRAPRPEDTAYKQAVKEYLDGIVRASTRHAAYPEDAREAGWTGTSSILFRVNTDGRPGESFVEASSGYAALDVTALLAVRRALRERPPPPVIKEKGMMATVAITFALPEDAHAPK